MRPESFMSKHNKCVLAAVSCELLFIRASDYSTASVTKANSKEIELLEREFPLKCIFILLL